MPADFISVSRIGPGEKPRGSLVVFVHARENGEYVVDVITPSGEPRTISVTEKAGRAILGRISIGGQVYLFWEGDNDEGAWLNG